VMLLEHPKYETRLRYVKGSVMDIYALQKVKAEEAKAFFVFVDKYELRQGGHEEDVHAILSTLAIKRFDPKARIIVEVFQLESQRHLEMYNLVDVDVICVEELRNGLLAHSCMHPGLSTIMVNMVRSVGHLEERTLAKRFENNQWLADYEWGATHQLYALDLGMFRGIAFGLLVEHLYCMYGYVLIAVEENATGLILRNPGNLYLLCNNDKGYVLSRSRLSQDHIERVENIKSAEFNRCIMEMRSKSTGKRQESVQSVHERLKQEKIKKAQRKEASLRQQEELLVASASGVALGSEGEVPVLLKGHIVVLGSIHGSRSFIEPLREKQQREDDIDLRPILIVSPEFDKTEIDHVLSPYKLCFHIEGSPLDRAVLRRAAVHHAQRVVILRDPGMNRRNEPMQDLHSSAAVDILPVMDAESIFCYREVLDMSRRGHAAQQDLPIVELMHLPNMRFLSLNALKCPQDEFYYTWPLIAAGQVFSTSMLDSLYCHVFFFSGCAH